MILGSFCAKGGTLEYILAVFKTRFSTLNFANSLKSAGVPVAVMNTPKAIGQVCGISVKFLSDFFSIAQSVLNKTGAYRNFEGFYSVSFSNGRQQIFKL